MKSVLRRGAIGVWQVNPEGASRNGEQLQILIAAQRHMADVVARRNEDGIHIRSVLRYPRAPRWPLLLRSPPVRVVPWRIAGKGRSRPSHRESGQGPEILQRDHRQPQSPRNGRPMMRAIPSIPQKLCALSGANLYRLRTCPNTPSRSRGLRE